jgi:hypothetical protein
MSQHDSDFRRQILGREVDVTPQVREALARRLAKVDQFLLRREAFEIVSGGEPMESGVKIFAREGHDAFGSEHAPCRRKFLNKTRVVAQTWQKLRSSLRTAIARCRAQSGNPTIRLPDYPITR